MYYEANGFGARCGILYCQFQVGCSAPIYEHVRGYFHLEHTSIAMPSRRDFLTGTAMAMGASSLAGAVPSVQTIQDVIDLITANIPGAPWEGSVDTVKSGDPTRPITGIVTTFLATGAVIEEAIRSGANLVITHEPTYYNHLDETDWLEHDAVYLAKRTMLEEHGIVVWRFHDYWHRYEPDGIATGVLRLLGWEEYAHPGQPDLCTIPPVRLSELVVFLKSRFGTPVARVMGDPDAECSNIGLLVGAWGGRRQISYLGREDVDVLVCGEVSEWETPEYVRDAALAGRRKALIILGHALSEEPGMQWLAEWLQPQVPDIPVQHVATGDPYRYV